MRKRKRTMILTILSLARADAKRAIEQADRIIIRANLAKLTHPVTPWTEGLKQPFSGAAPHTDKVEVQTKEKNNGR